MRKTDQFIGLHICVQDGQERCVERCVDLTDELMQPSGSKVPTRRLWVGFAAVGDDHLAMIIYEDGVSGHFRYVSEITSGEPHPDRHIDNKVFTELFVEHLGFFGLSPARYRELVLKAVALNTPASAAA